MSWPAAVTERSFSRAWMTILAERQDAPIGGSVGRYPWPYPSLSVTPKVHWWTSRFRPRGSATPEVHRGLLEPGSAQRTAAGRPDRVRPGALHTACAGRLGAPSRARGAETLPRICHRCPPAAARSRGWPYSAAEPAPRRCSPPSPWIRWSDGICACQGRVRLASTSPRRCSSAGRAAVL
jgi:hypothetical protein